MPRLKGLSFPLQFNKRGSLSVTTGVDKIKENIRAIVLTSVGERVMNPHIGSVGYQYLFRNLETSEKSILKHQIREGIERGEGRITVLVVNVDQPDQEGQLQISMEFRIDTSNEFENLTFFV